MTTQLQFIIIIIMFLKGWACFLFLDPQDEVGPSISSSVVQFSFVLWVYIVVLVLVVYLCPSSVHVVATFSGTVLFPLLCSVLPFFAQYIDSFLYLVLFPIAVNKYYYYTSSPIKFIYLNSDILQADSFIEISSNIYYWPVLINLSLKQFILEVFV